IVDLDGTLADCEHRRVYITREPKNWDKFFSPRLVLKDPLIEPVSRVVRLLSATETIVFASGRKESLRHVSIAWLRQHDLWTDPFALYLRPDGDFRSDTIVKMEMLGQIRADGYDPWLVIDDRSSVVAMWREQGLTCFQVEDGDF
ncbi:MAG: hypothetical protein K8F91_09400, partial [Candidatus Obscuribacterales bacterium]|nr:hypothetical protein [Candidatus Obscuribacterales bacterium]